MNHRIIVLLNFIFLAIILFSCKKLVEVDGPPTSVSSKNVFSNNATAIGALTSLYVNLSNGVVSSPGELIGLSCIGGLSADELTYFKAAGSSTLAAYYENSLSPLNAGGGGDYWGTTYKHLFVVNAAIEGLTASNELIPGVKNHLLGESRFMRAFYYFYLVNLYGDVPLILSTDYTRNAVIKKSDKSQVYNQIVIDLKEAQTLLSDNYLKSDLVTDYPTGLEERVRPTKWAATALLARTYLFMGKWAEAEMQASTVLINTSKFLLEPLKRTFLKNNMEAIWQLQPTQYGYNTVEGNTFIVPTEGPSYLHPVFLRRELLDDFEIADQRKSKWIESINANGTNYYYPYKYKAIQSSIGNNVVTEYSTVLRLAEQYLIRAEARAYQGNLIGAIDDIDRIRGRAGLTLIRNINPGISKDDLIILILKEKRIELFAEWGHRWLDLKRTGMIDEVMTKVTAEKNNGAAWESHQQYYPIWSYELQSNPNLTQNSGY